MLYTTSVIYLLKKRTVGLWLKFEKKKYLSKVKKPGSHLKVTWTDGTWCPHFCDIVYHLSQRRRNNTTATMNNVPRKLATHLSCTFYCRLFSRLLYQAKSLFCFPFSTMVRRKTFCFSIRITAIFLILFFGDGKVLLFDFLERANITSYNFCFGVKKLSSYRVSHPTFW